MRRSAVPVVALTVLLSTAAGLLAQTGAPKPPQPAAEQPPPGGTGEGTLIPTALVDFTTSGSISVEAFGWMPRRLIEVAVEEPKGKKR